MRTTFFVATESQPRVRRAADGVTVAIGVLLAVWGVIGIDRQTPGDRALTDLLTTLPSWVDDILALGYALGLLYGLGIVAAMLGAGRRGGLRDATVAAILAMGLAVILARVVSGSWPYVLPELGLEDPQPRFPVLRVVLVAAILVAASPHLSRPMRRLGWLMIAVSAVAAVALGYGLPSDTVGGLGLGLIAASTVLLVAGSPRGYPDREAVADALRRMGLTIDTVWISPEQSWGVRTLGAATGDGAAIAVKAYGRDASDSQVMAKAWRTLWYREDRRVVSYSRLQAVEHEALVTLMADRAGARVPEVIAAGRASAEIVLLAVTAGGRPLTDLDPPHISDDVIVGVWQDVARLHASSISHGSLTAAAIHVDESGHTISDFGLGSVVADETDRCLDVVELLFSLSAHLGTERATRTARTGLGADALAAVLPYLQLPAISVGTRKRTEKPRIVIGELQAAVVAATGRQAPEPVKLRRVTARTLLTMALLVLAAWALIPALTGVDYAAVWDELKVGDWGLMFVALLIGQAVFLSQASGMMFAVPSALPFWPLVTLQIASNFIGLAVPSIAGRVAMNAAFLHRFGLSVTIAVAQGAIDGFAGFLIQTSILLVALLAGDVDLGLDVDNLDVNWSLVLIGVVLVIVATVVAVTRIHRLRERVLPVVSEGWAALASVLREPSRAFGLLGSNLVTNMVLGATLWLILEAMGSPVGFGAALVAVVSTFLLQGLVPIPGGVGVAEAVLSGLLVAMGVDQPVAFAAAIVYRAITFYLPALEGLFAMRWLERNDYV